MALTIAQKSSVRRHLGYPVAGLYKISPAAGTFASGSVGYRFTQAYGFLEYKMNNLNPDEEARLTGYAYGAVALTGPLPSAGDSISITLSGGNIATPQVVTATLPSDYGNQDPRLALIAILAGESSLNAALVAAQVAAVNPFGTGPFSQNAVPLPEMAWTSPVPFDVSNPTGTGTQAPTITAIGEQLPPSTSLDGTTTIYGYLPILDGLENAHASSSQNLDTIQADVWKGRINEAGARMSLYTTWRGMLSDFLGTPINPQRRNNPKRTTAVRYA